VTMMVDYIKYYQKKSRTDRWVAVCKTWHPGPLKIGYLGRRTDKQFCGQERWRWRGSLWWGWMRLRLWWFGGSVCKTWPSSPAPKVFVLHRMAGRWSLLHSPKKLFKYLQYPPQIWLVNPLLFP
jgi:hypothetical protein